VAHAIFGPKLTKIPLLKRQRFVFVGKLETGSAEIHPYPPTHSVLLPSLPSSHGSPPETSSPTIPLYPVPPEAVASLPAKPFFSYCAHRLLLTNVIAIISHVPSFSSPTFDA
jgi:hypothetical protein